MKKRIVSLCLVLSMAMSMISCGGTKNEEKPAEKKADAAALFQSLEDMEAKTSEMTLDFDVSGKCLADTKMDKVKVAIKASSIIESDNKAQVELSYRLGDSTEFKQLTNAVLDGKAMYFDFSTLKTAAVDICNVLKFSEGAAVASMIPDAKYIKMDENTFKELLKEAGETDITIPSMDLAKQKESQKVLMAASEFVLAMVQGAVKDVQPAIINGSDHEINFDITKENVTAFCDAILALDLEAKVDELVQKMNAAGDAKEYTDGIVKSKKDVVSGIKKALNEFKKEKDNFKAFGITANVAVDGEKGARKVTEKFGLNIEDNEDKVVASIEAEIGEQAAEGKTVTVPTDAIDFMTYMNQISELMQ